jgi:hypothetical protein
LVRTRRGGEAPYVGHIFPSRRVYKDELRRNILAGATLLAKVESGDFDSRSFRRWLDKALTREDDRELFGLPPT